MKTRFLGIAAAVLLTSGQCMADDLRVLSAGAMQRGLITVAAKFKEKSGTQVQIRYATAPELKKILTENGAAADAILAPNPTLTDLAGAGKIAADTQKEIGGVGSAVLIRPDAPVPDISSMAAFKRALTEADALVYNRASSGVYIDSMLHKIGVFDQVQAKIVRVDDGEAVATRIKQGHGKEFGFGGYTDVLHNEEMGGVKLVGPIPEEVQNYTMYSSALIAAAPSPTPARALLAFLATPEAQAIFLASGVVPKKR
ncbi:MAG TPA: substrate-binding domain-containing protein [Xanthobacteraceae bacterium]